MESDNAKVVMDSVGPASVQLLEYAVGLAQVHRDHEDAQFWAEYMQQEYCLADLLAQI